MDEATINLFIIGDIENHGFNKEYQDIWYEEKDNKILGIALRYHTMLIVYSKDLDMDFSLIKEILGKYSIDAISGEQSVIDIINEDSSGDYNRTDTRFCELRELPFMDFDLDKIEIAGEEDAMEIAIAYGDIEEFKELYSPDVNKRYEQILTRIKSGEGKHLFIRDSKGIVAHGNTTAENSTNAMIGGIFTRQDMRERGYGSLITYALAKELLDKNKTVCLFYKDESPGRIFKKIGFKHIGNWSVLGGIR